MISSQVIQSLFTLTSECTLLLTFFITCLYHWYRNFDLAMNLRFKALNPADMQGKLRQVDANMHAILIGNDRLSHSTYDRRYRGRLGRSGDRGNAE